MAAESVPRAHLFGITSDLKGKVIVGGTAVSEGENVDVGVGCIGPAQAANRKRMLITAWELFFFMIAPVRLSELK